jgi:putative transposase
MPEQKALTARSVAERWREVKTADQWWEDAYDTMRDVFKKYLEDSLECEILEQLQAEQYQRNPDRVDSRNGYRYRSVATRLGVIQNLRLPRSRDGKYHSQILPSHERRGAEMDDVVCASFLAGVSTRRVGEVLEPLTGEAISATTVSRISKALDGAVRRYHERALGDNVRYLFLDGIGLRIKGVAGVQHKIVLAAYALTTAGERVLLDFRIATAESAAQWEAFLNCLYRRGLEGKNLRLIVTDGNSGLHEALQVVYGFVPRQRCWVHKLRNVTSKSPARSRDECLSGLRPVYMAESKDNARQRYRVWSEKWKKIVPKAVECVEKDIDELLTFLDEPLALASKLRTTNAIERAFREVRRRTNPMSCFNDDASCERIIYAVFNQQNRKWKDRPLAEFTHNT